GRRVHGNVGARIDRAPQVDEAPWSMPRRQLAPDDVVLLAPVDGLRIEAVFLRWIRGQEPRAPLVLERPEHAPRMDRLHLLELGRGLRKLSRSERKRSQHLPGERA